MALSTEVLNQTGWDGRRLQLLAGRPQKPLPPVPPVGSSFEVWPAASFLSRKPRNWGEGSASSGHGDDVVVTAKIALAHLKEFPDYYTRLAKMEREADEYWAERR